MTKQKKSIPPSAIALSRGVDLELRKSRLGAALTISGVMSVSELSSDSVAALSQYGRFYIRGERLSVLALENRTLAVYGRVTGIEMTYGKA